MTTDERVHSEKLVLKDSAQRNVYVVRGTSCHTI